MKVKSLREAYRSGKNGLAFMDEGKGPKLCDKINSIGGWRGLFDNLAHEWNQCPDLNAKWATIEEMKLFFNCRLDGLIYLYIQDCIDLGKQYRIAAVPGTIYEFAGISIEAENYLKHCKHPAFRRAAWHISLSQASKDGWKEAMDDAINCDGEIFNLSSCRQLLIDT